MPRFGIKIQPMLYLTRGLLLHPVGVRELIRERMHALLYRDRVASTQAHLL